MMMMFEDFSSLSSAFFFFLFVEHRRLYALVQIFFKIYSPLTVGFSTNHFSDSSQAFARYSAIL